MKRFVFVFVLCVLCYNSLLGADMQYASDNGAYWYLRVFSMEPEFGAFERAKVYAVNSLDSYSSLSEETKKKLESALTPDFMKCLKAANTAQYCWFINEPQSAEVLNDNYPLQAVKNGYRFINALGWSAISMKKDKAGVNLWLSMMKMSEKAATMQNISSAQIIGFSLQKRILTSISEYLSKTKDEDIKNTVLNYLSNIPANVYNLKSIMETQHKYVVLILNNLERNTEALAKYFGSELSPKHEEIQECHRRLGLIASALEEYQAENVTYFEDDVSKIISDLYENKRLSLDTDYDCPLDKKRSIKWSDEADENGNFGFQIICNCEKEFPAPRHLSPDAPSMVKARAYRNTIFETHKQQVENYWNKIMEFDFDSNASQIELQKLFSIHKPEYRENLLMIHLGINFTTLKSSLDEIENRRNSIIAKYLKEEIEVKDEEQDDLQETGSEYSADE